MQSASLIFISFLGEKLVIIALGTSPRSCHISVGARGINAQTLTTSLYIPGYEGPQPVNADMVGVGSNGRTTWVVHDGATGSSPTTSTMSVEFIGSGERLLYNCCRLPHANYKSDFTLSLNLHIQIHLHFIKKKSHFGRWFTRCFLNICEFRRKLYNRTILHVFRIFFTRYLQNCSGWKYCDSNGNGFSCSC